MARAFNNLGLQLLQGRINFASVSISARLITTDARNAMPSLKENSTFFDAINPTWYPYDQAAIVVPGVVTLATTEDGPVAKVVVPDIVFPGLAYPTNVYYVLFYVDTGNPTTSPLIGYDEIGPVAFAEGTKYTYKSSTDGLIQLALT